MAAKHQIEIAILAETKKAAGALKRFSKDAGLDGLGDKVKSVGIGVAAGVGALVAGAGIYLKGGVDGAADLQQSMGAIDTVFKGSADQMHKWGKGAADAVGLTQNAYNELATVLGTQLKNGGTAIDQIGGKTNELVGLGADLASMFGGNTSDAVAALSSALKGERDPIERYGVSLKQASIDAKAAELGFDKVGGSLSAEGQQAATLALIMEQTADAHGNFAKEADALQGKQARLSANWENLQTRIGSALLPAISALVGMVSTRLMPVLEEWGTKIVAWIGPALSSLGGWLTGTAIPAVMAFGDYLRANVLPVIIQWGGVLVGTLWPALVSLGGWLVSAKGWLIPLAVGVAAIVAAYRAWTIATAAWKAITTLAAAAQGILNAVMAANPIGIIVLAIVGLVAGLVTLYNTNETARRIIDTAWKSIRAAIDAVVAWIMGTAVPWVTSAWTTLSTGAVDLYNKVRDAFVNTGTAIGDFVSAAKARIGEIIDGVVDFARSVGDKTGEVIQFFKELPGKALGALEALPGRLKSMGRQMIEGFIAGVRDMAGRLVGAVTGVIDDAIGGAKRLLGIASPSRVFRVIGEQTGEGMEIGLERVTARVARAASRMAAAVVDGGTVDPLPGPRAALAAAPTVIHVNVQTLVPTADTGRLIAAALRPYLKNGGVIR